MEVTASALSVLVAAATTFAAVRKLQRSSETVSNYERVGVPEERLRPLALLLLGGAVGLMAGILWAPAGIAAAAGLVIYFVTAVGAHIRFGEMGDIGTPIAIALLAAVVLGLRLAAL